MRVKEKGVLKDSVIFFHTPSNTAKSLFYYVNCCGEYYCNEFYNVKREYLNSFLIMYIKNGSGTISFEGKNYTAKKNDLVIMDCHRPHSYFTNSGWEIIWLHYDGNNSEGFSEELYSRMGYVFNLGDSLIIPKYLKFILEDFRKENQICEPLISCFLQRILTEIMLLNFKSNEKNEMKFDEIIEIINYIEENYKDKITIKELAALANLSIFHFSRVFKKKTGYSPYEFLIKTRINKAKFLLKNSSLSIKEISYSVGFNSESNFVNTFHNSVNMTPFEFRVIQL